MADPTTPAAWAAEVRDAATATLSTLPELTGREEDWRFTPPADLGLGGDEPEAPGVVEAPPVPGGARAEELMSMPLRDAREIFEREYLTAQINRFGGNISRTAEFIGMERSALHRKLKSLGIG